MNIFYKIVEVWCKYPFQHEIEERYCLFSYSKRKFKAIEGLKIDSNTSIKDKEDYLKEKLNLKRVKVLKVK